MRKIDFPPTFKKEMSNIEIEGVEAIVKNFKYEDGSLTGEDVDFSHDLSGHYNSHNIMSDLSLYDDEGNKYEVNHVGITERDDAVILVCEDREGNEHYFEIEPKDF